MDTGLRTAAEAVGEVCSRTADVDEIGRVAANLASQVARPGGISEAEATLLTLIAAGHAKDGAAKAGLAAEQIEAAGARAEAAARHGVALGLASLDNGLPDVEGRARRLVALRLQEDQGVAGGSAGHPGDAGARVAAGSATPPSAQSAAPAAAQGATQAAAQSATPAAAAPDWYADPLGRHQFRYWDGAAWTDVVADNGRQSADPLSPASAPAGWLADPTGRHQYRYWDGAAWTDVVADNGQQSADPLSHASPQQSAAAPLVQTTGAAAAAAAAASAPLTGSTRVSCSICGADLGRVETQQFAGAGEDQWLGNVCVPCGTIYCGNCIAAGYPTPCPACGVPTAPATSGYLRQIGAVS